MEEKSQVVERETKKDEIHEKDGKAKRYVNNRLINMTYSLFDFQLSRMGNDFSFVHCAWV